MKNHFNAVVAEVVVVVVAMLMTALLLSCSSIKYVDFEDSSELCKSTRQIVHIESKMIPPDSVLNERYKTPKCIGENETVTPETDDDENSKLLDEGENFVTRPDGRFFRASVEEGKYLVYWIHYISPDPHVLELLSDDDETIWKIVNSVIKQVYSEGLLKTNQWENELNTRILNALIKKPELKNLTKVVIHLGC